MIGLLIAAFENLTGRAKGPVEKPKGEMEEEDAKGNDEKGEANQSVDSGR